MRTHVTFQADFSKDAGRSAPAGRDLAHALASHLQTGGLTVGPPATFEGYAYAVSCRRAQHTIVVFVALVDDGVQEWLVYAEPHVGAVRRWLRKVGLSRARSNASPLLGEVCTAPAVVARH